MTSIGQQLQHSLGSLQPHRLVVAYSGGLDSTVLLHAAKAHCSDSDVLLHAVHVNHQLSPNAVAWQAHCSDTCQALGIPFTPCVVGVTNTGNGVEDAARVARYKALEEVLADGDVLLMGHHADDQAETFLLRLSRGSGVQGLAATRSRRVLPLASGEASLVRPFLAISRADLLQYAQAHDLQWVEDESNQSDQFDRNFLRHNVIPSLTERWPRFVASANRAARHFSEVADLLKEYSAQDLQSLEPKLTRAGHKITLPPNDWSAARAGTVLRHWMATLDLNAPSQAQLEQLLGLISAAEDAQPLLQLGGHGFRRYQNGLFCQLLNVTNVEVPELWHTDNPLILPGNMQLAARSATEGLAAGQYRVAFRQPGLRAHPHQRAHSQTLKKLLQEHCLEPWLRDQVPLLFRGEQLVAVGDLWIEQSAWTDQNAVSLSWQRALAD